MIASLKSWTHFAVLLGMLALPALLISAEPSVRAKVDAGSEAKTVELFAAMESHDIDVKFIAKDDREANVLIKNNTSKPLNVKLPEAFAASPVMAQRLGGGGGAAGGRPGGAAQTTGGGMGGMGGGMGGMGGGMGMMSVAPEKIAQLKVATVCLEHGKRDPRPAIAYEIKPLESFSTKPELKQLLTTFGKKGLNQRAAQAAAWHFADNMSWEQLAAKRREHFDGSSDPWFSEDELQAGMRIASDAAALAEKNTAENPPSKAEPASEKPTNRTIELKK